MALDVSCSLTSVYEYSDRDHYVNCKKSGALFAAIAATSVIVLIVIVAAVIAFVSDFSEAGFAGFLLILVPFIWLYYAVSSWFANRSYDLAEVKATQLQKLYPTDSPAQIRARLRMEEINQNNINRLANAGNQQVANPSIIGYQSGY